MPRTIGIATCDSQHVFLDRLDEARFAQTRFANDEHNLAHALLRLLPAIRQQADFSIAPGQRRAHRRSRFSEAALMRDCVSEGVRFQKLVSAPSMIVPGSATSAMESFPLAFVSASAANFPANSS